MTQRGLALSHLALVRIQALPLVRGVAIGLAAISFTLRVPIIVTRGLIICSFIAILGAGREIRTLLCSVWKTGGATLRLPALLPPYRRTLVALVTAAIGE